MSRRCLITGVTGQDGAYLARFLIGKGYEVWGTYRKGEEDFAWRIDALEIGDKLRLVQVRFPEASNIIQVLEESNPDEIYHLAAQSNIGLSFERPVYTGEVTGLGTPRLLEAVRKVNPKIKFYQASSSEMFGASDEVPQNEKTPFRPQSPYAIAKLYAHWAAVNYREAYGIYAVSGICFNHESHLRGLEFVTRKIAHGVAKIKHGFENELHLGNLNARRDWGYAPDYVEAMWSMLQQNEPNDYVIATGEAHSVQDFAATAFRIAGLNWEDHVRIDKSLIRPTDSRILVGDAKKARIEMGWKPKTRFEELVQIMVAADLELVAGENTLARHSPSVP